MQPAYDVFLGHATADKDDGVRAFADELEGLGLRIFVDEREIGAFDSITTGVEEAIACSLVFVAWYSHRYPERRACQLELRRAYVAAEGAGAVGERILPINPESGFEHIDPATLRDARIPSDNAASAVLARVDAVRRSGGYPLGELTRSQAPAWIPQRSLGSPRFVGRVSELWALHDHLSAKATSQVTGTTREEVAIVGLGGMGKSLLAEEYAYSFGPAFPGGVYWLTATRASAGDDAVLLDHLATVAAALEVSLDDHPDRALLRHRMAVALAERERALWIVDDLPEGLTAGDVQAWLAPHERAATLVTTRSADYTALPQLTLDVLDPDAALLLLTAGADPSSEEEWEAARIVAAQLLGYHAQSLDLARSQIALRPGATAYREFVRRTREASLVERLEHAATITAQLPNGHEASIVATMRTAIDGLGEGARDLLRLAGELGVAPIDIDLAVVATAGGSEGQDAALDRLDSALAQLGASSLARRSLTASGESAFFVHGVCSAIARHIDTQPERAAALRGRATVALVDWLADRNDVYDQTQAAELESRIAHTRALTTSLDQTDDPALTALGYLLARVDVERGAYGSAQALHEQVLAARERLFGATHPDTLTSKNDLARTLWRQGRYARARELQEEVLAACERLLGAEHQETLRTKNNLANTLSDQDHLKRARKHQEQVLAARKRLLGPEHPDTLTSKNNLANTLWKQEHLKAARRLQEQVVAAQQRLLGPGHPDTLASKNNLANTLSDQGHLKAARKLQEEVVAASERVLGPEHPTTLAAKHNLANTLWTEGGLKANEDHLKAAEKLQMEVAAASERVLGPDHPATLRSQRLLALTMFTRPRLDYEVDPSASPADPQTSSRHPQLTSAPAPHHD